MASAMVSATSSPIFGLAEESNVLLFNRPPTSDLQSSGSMPAIRYPLLDALRSQANEPQPSFLAPRRPILPRSTQNSRLLRSVGHSMRHGYGDRGNGVTTGSQEAPLETPRAPPDRAKPAPKALANPGGSRPWREEVRNLEEGGVSEWPLSESKSAPSLGNREGLPACPTVIKDTWTSGVRALRGTGRRLADRKLASSSPAGTARFAGAVLQDASKKAGQGVPKPVKEWMGHGEGFTNGGFGVEQRFQPTPASPGLAHNDAGIGALANWSPEASLPTRQACAQHHSSAAHTMGARREDPQRPRHELGPGPGTYESQGFVQEMMARLARSPKG